MMITALEGGCACRRIRYCCDAEPIFQLVCHCRDCQRASGSAFAEAILIDRQALSITGEQPKYHTATADSGRSMQRGFCGACGSPLLIVKPDLPQIAFLQAASLDDPGIFQPTLEIFTARARPWVHSWRDIPRLEGPPIPAVPDAIAAYFSRKGF